MSSTREIVVIGGGPAGVAAAIESARHGAGVTMIMEEPIGGRATHASLVPSKVLLHLVAERKTRKSAGLLGADDIAHIVSEMERIAGLEATRMSRRLEDAGITMVRGSARFVATDAVEIAREGKDPRRERFDAAIVAAGSVPSFPAGFFGEAKGPDGERIIAPRHLRSLRDLPATMLVIGGGATGAEAVYAFLELGVEVTWILDELGILPGFDRELGESLGDVLMERGVKLVHDKPVLEVTRVGDRVHAKLDGGRTYAAERAFIAIGRKADTARLGLEAIGVATDARTGAIVVDAQMRSSVPSVLAAGDAAGAPFIANKSAIEGWIAGRVAAGRAAPGALSGSYVETVYTEPELAMVGLTPHRAMVARRTIDVRTIGFDESVKGTLHGVGVEVHARGTLRVVVDPESQLVLGATLDALATSGMAAPTFGELAGAAGRA